MCTQRPRLTERQQSILDFIVAELRDKGYPPTLREISSEFGIASTQGVRRHIDALEKKGYIVRDSGARSITVLDELDREQEREGMETVGVPLLGEVAAGVPIFADQNVEETVPVGVDWLSSSGEHFFLRVRGMSMADSILPGDLVLVERTVTARHGEIVVALLEDEATVKRFFQKDGILKFTSDNPDYEDIVPSERFQILGRVRALMRRY